MTLFNSHLIWNLRVAQLVNYFLLVPIKVLPHVQEPSVRSTLTQMNPVNTVFI
jgi:hypothetical protein